MTTESREDAILSRVREELVAEGYDVVVRPTQRTVPAFLGTLLPDALAFGKENNLVVEVASQNPRTELRLRRLRNLVEQQSGWDLRLFWTTAGTATRSLPEADEDGITATLEEIEAILIHRQPRAALLLAWGCLEALARKVLSADIPKPQSPGRVVERLALEGYITPVEAEELRKLAQRRNRLIHGDLATDVRRKHVAEMLTVLRRLFAESQAQTRGSQQHDLMD